MMNTVFDGADKTAGTRLHTFRGFSNLGKFLVVVALLIASICSIELHHVVTTQGKLSGSDVMEYPSAS
jgi:hypothetical protein